MVQGICGRHPVLQLAGMVHRYPQLKLGLLHQTLSLRATADLHVFLVAYLREGERRGAGRGGGGGWGGGGGRGGGWGRGEGQRPTSNSRPSYLSGSILLGEGFEGRVGEGFEGVGG